MNLPVGRRSVANRMLPTTNTNGNAKTRAVRMYGFKRYAWYSLMSAVAAIVAMAVAGDPRTAEANKSTDLSPAIVTGGASVAPDCRDAVWPYVTGDCLVLQDADSAPRVVRIIFSNDTGSGRRDD